MTAVKNFDCRELDRRVTLSSPTATQSASGEVARAFSSVCTVWAALLPLGGARFSAAEGKHYDGSFRYRIRYRSGVLPGYRLTVAGDALEIVHVAEIGRREFLDLTCRGVDSAAA